MSFGHSGSRLLGEKSILDKGFGLSQEKDTFPLHKHISHTHPLLIRCP